MRAKPDSKGEGEAQLPLGLESPESASPMIYGEAPSRGHQPEDRAKSPISFPVISVSAVTPGSDRSR